MYESQYNSNPNMTLNPFTDSVEATIVFQSQVEFLDSLKNATRDAGGNPDSVCQPNITLTELMNQLAINGIRFTFDPKLKKGKPLPSVPDDTAVVLPAHTE